jgi:chromatin remodeling complex protein RSC6
MKSERARGTERDQEKDAKASEKGDREMRNKRNNNNKTGKEKKRKDTMKEKQSNHSESLRYEY